jgi:hypothetical protein
MLSLRYLRVPELERLLVRKNGPRAEYAPTWIKSYVDRLHDYEFHALTDSAKGHYFMLCLLAAELDNRLPLAPDWLAMQIGAKEPIDLGLLLNAGFLELVDLNPDTGEIQAMEPAALAATNGVTFPATIYDTNSVNGFHDKIRVPEGKGMETNGNKGKAMDTLSATPRKQGRPSRATPSPPDPDPAPVPIAKEEHSQIERVVEFLQNEIHNGNLQIEKLAPKAFPHLSKGEWEEVKRRLHAVAAGLMFFFFDSLADICDLALAVGCG